MPVSKAGYGCLYPGQSPVFSIRTAIPVRLPQNLLHHAVNQYASEIASTLSVSVDIPAVEHGHSFPHGVSTRLNRLFPGGKLRQVVVSLHVVNAGNIIRIIAEVFRIQPIPQNILRYKCNTRWLRKQVALHDARHHARYMLSMGFIAAPSGRILWHGIDVRWKHFSDPFSILIHALRNHLTVELFLTAGNSIPRIQKSLNGIGGQLIIGIQINQQFPTGVLKTEISGGMHPPFSFLIYITGWLVFSINGLTS